MAVIFWKSQHKAFNTLVGKTSLDIAIEKYAQTGAAEDFHAMQVQLVARGKLTPCQMTPLDIVVERISETGNSKDLQMLRALVKARSHTSPVPAALRRAHH